MLKLLLIEDSEDDAFLLGRALDPADRPGLEAGVASRTAELARLGQRALELDAAVDAARAC